MALQPNEGKYATVNTPEKFWTFWKEDNLEKPVQKIINQSAGGVEAEERLPTEQDKLLYALCRKERVMEFAYKFVVFDAGAKKIARYQQYFAVKNTLERVKETDENGNRKGGVIWHTQGSGKSLTMVMLSKCLSLDAEIDNPRVILVTDRVDLDTQIRNTFYYCGKSPRQAKSGSHLVRLLKEGDAAIITTVIDKFESGLNRQKYCSEDQNVFVLVDESHRSQYGNAHAKMKKILPNACYIGFTGTPLMKQEKNTARKFGGFIDRYTIDQAVEDKAVLPLLYEGRSAKLSVNREQLDKQFNRVSEGLSEYQTKDLKQKYASLARIYQSQQVIEEVAEDICRHYSAHWKGTEFKAQLAVPDKLSAIRYYRYFEEQHNPDLKVNTAVVISPPDQREGYDHVHDDNKDEVIRFWKNYIEQYGSAEQYERNVINSFKNESEEVEILIVVNKLLTGFDAPRNTVLYLAKPLSDHNLLQAIARVNRLFKGKDYGYVVDYVRLLGNLDKALTEYSALEAFEEQDLAGAVQDVKKLIKDVPQKHSALWDVFKEVTDKKDHEALERHLAPEDRRNEFYQRLTDFAKTLQAALATDAFYDAFSEQQIEYYKKELKFFRGMRMSVSKRFADKVDFKEYEKRIKKLLDTHILVDEVETVTEPVNIFDEEVFKREVEEATGKEASKADEIAHRIKKELNDRMDEDPIYYKKFSELIEEAIKAFHEERLSEAEYLKRVVEVRNKYVAGASSDIPSELQNKPQARAFFGAVNNVLENNNKEEINQEVLVHAGKDIAAIIEKLTIRDWKRNPDIQKEMKNQVEDYLFEQQNLIGRKLSYDEMDEILDTVLKIAKHNY